MTIPKPLRIAQTALIGLMAMTAIACQLEPPIETSPPSVPTAEATPSASPTASPTANSSQANPGTYRSDRFGFQFSYPTEEFAIIEPPTPANNEDSPLETIDIWTQEHAQKIKAGAYEGGTEYPPNVQVTVASNPQKLSLQAWVQQSNQFSVTRNFKDTTVAGQNAIAFEASGLYENEHVAFNSPEGSNVVVITFSKINYGDHDATYRRAYEQVINSFTFAG